MIASLPKAILIVLAIALAGGAFLYFAPTLSPPAPPPPPAEKPPLLDPWIEVTAPLVSEVRGDSRRTLASGDTIRAGAEIHVGEKGRATLHFPDGSVARLFEGTTLTMSEATYNPADGTLVVRLRLGLGRVWSKLVGLATPASTWEVKTSNAVAVVRGTAFGIEYRQGKSRVVVTENKVAVHLVDPKTDTVVKENAALVDAHTFVAVEDRHAAAAAAEATAPAAPGVTRVELVPQPLSPALLKEDWIRESQERDTPIREKLETLKREIPDLQKLHLRVREELFEKPLEILRTTLPAEETPSTPPELLPKREEPLRTDVSPQPAEVTPLPSRTSPTPKSLALVMKTPLTEVVEGADVALEAVLVMSDGSRRTATGDTGWHVVGPIGTMAKPGVFRPKLAPSVAELGEAQGAIVASWKDSATGKEFISQTPLFKVKARIEFVPPEG